MVRILVISDIHGNYPALLAVADHADIRACDYILNCGDSIVYAPFANQVLHWLDKHNVISILGNTDCKVIKLLKGKNFQKPATKEKRIMYTHTAETLTRKNRLFLRGLSKHKTLKIKKKNIAMFHGSPEKHSEFLFATTPKSRFRELAEQSRADIIITGHAHTPYHKSIAKTHFINPGSVGRMFDGSALASFAILTLDKHMVHVQMYRCDYDIEAVIVKLSSEGLPNIYAEMYKQGKKLN